MATFLKQVETSMSTVRENTTSKSLSGAEIIYTLGNRTVASKEANYFSSFNLPYTLSEMASGSTLSKLRPEMFQLNVDKIALVSITRDNYSEYIDGRSVTLNVPQVGGTSKKIVSAFFSESDNTVKTNNDSILGQNIAFLFCDDINRPFSGTSEGLSVSRHTLTTWDPTTDFKDRPNAVAYRELLSSDKNSDPRTWSSVNKAVYVDEGYPNPLDKGYNYDIPVGFVALDKGYMVLTHPLIVDYIPWTSGNTVYITGSTGDVVVNQIPNTGTTSASTNVVFGAVTSAATSAVTSTLTYQDVYTSYSTSVVCIAMPKEFFISTNPTWDRATNLSEISNETYDLDSIYVTQIGLYNIEGDLVAVAKMDRPIEKTYTNVLTFNLNIEV